jgi:hypothetical protein
MNVKRQTYRVTTTGTRLNLADVPFKPVAIFVTVEQNSIRIAYDNSMPSPDEGHLIYIGQFFSMDKPPLIAQFAMASITGVAKVTVTLEG